MGVFVSSHPTPWPHRTSPVRRGRVWLNWPARVSAPLAASLGVDPHALHVALDAAVREHLEELGELRIRVD